MDNNQTPAPLSADSLREQIDLCIEPLMAAVGEAKNERRDDTQSFVDDAIERLQQLTATALQLERQRIADSLLLKIDELPCSTVGMDEWRIRKSLVLEAVRAVLTAEGPRLTSKGETTQ